MKTSYYHILHGLLIFTFVSCNQTDCKEMTSFDKVSTPNSPIDTSTKKEYVDRFSIIGDFNGDKKVDTVFESYISKLTNVETYKKLDNDNWEHNQELIIKNRPETRLYTSISAIDTFIVTSEPQQIGLYHFRNLGDINNDGKDEVGYAVNWADNSNINTYHILTLKDNKFKEIFSFQINEILNFEPEQLFDNSELIKQIGKKTIKYKFYSDSATVETGEHKFH